MISGLIEDIQFDIHDSLTNELIGNLDLDDWSFNDPINGVGQFSGSILLQPQSAEYLRTITQPWRYSIYARLDEVYLWGGTITSRPWSRSKSSLTIAAEQWEGWLYRRLLQTKYVKKNIDQFTIVRDLVANALRDVGCPRWTILATSASIIRDLTVDPWTSYGEAIDRLAARDPGFDWSIQVRKHRTTGRPDPYLQLWYPERKSVKDPLIMLESIQGEDLAGSSGNTSFDEWPDDSSNLVSRMWAVGDGTSNDKPAVYDQDQDLTDGPYYTLLTEASTNWSGVLRKVTLQDHARRERKYRGAPIQTIAVNVNASNPDIRDYMVGDRVRFVAKDRWVDVDYPGVRILDRAIRGGRGKTEVTLVLDLNDFEAPNEETGVDA